MHNSKKSRTFAPSIRWKDAGVDERTALEMRRTGNCTGGSNPSLSAPSQPRPRPTARPRFAFGGRRFPAAARSPGTNIHLPGPFLSSFKKSLSFSLNFTTNNGWAHEKKKKKKFPRQLHTFCCQGDFGAKTVQRRGCLRPCIIKGSDPLMIQKKHPAGIGTVPSPVGCSQFCLCVILAQGGFARLLTIQQAQGGW